MAEYAHLVGAVALVTGDRQSAEDAVAEAVARAWEYTEKGGSIDSLRAWVGVVAMNQAFSGLRRLRSERRYRQRALGSEFFSPDPEDLVDLRRALAALPRTQRIVTVLRYYLDLDIHDVAEHLGVSDGTVKASLFKARKSLAKALKVDAQEETSRVERL